jgi:putative restriction endonuclease
MADILLEHVGVQNVKVEALTQGATDDGKVIAAIEDQIEQQIKNNTDIDATEKVAVSKARLGQGRFRANVLSIEATCRITGVSDPRLLRAGHIKPWISCANNHERLDGYNGLSLAPNIDHLFNEGYISFEDDGTVLVSPRIDVAQLALLGIALPKSVGVFQPQRLPYLEFHRRNIFYENLRRLRLTTAGDQEKCLPGADRAFATPPKAANSAANPH